MAEELADRPRAASAIEPIWSEPPLDDLLFQESYRFAFFQAVRLLGRLHPGRKPPGRDSTSAEEFVRFRAHLSLLFPASEVYDITQPPAEGAGRAEMTVTFFGLTGLMGALPRGYTEILLDRVGRKDHTLRTFLDLFNHRLVSLFYRAWEKYRFWIGYERAEREVQSRRQAGKEAWRAFVTQQRRQADLLSDLLLDVVGMGEPALRYRSQVRHELAPRLRIDDEALRFYAGHLAQRRRSAIALESLLEDYFAVAVSVVQFRGQWLRLDPDNQTCLAPEGGNTDLGRNAIAGVRFWDVQGMFRVRLGPLSYAEFCRFLPDGDAAGPLRHWCRLYAGAQFDFDVQLVLRGPEVPWCQLGGADGGAQLGWDTWIRTTPFSRDVADAVFAVQDL